MESLEASEAREGINSALHIAPDLLSAFGRLTINFAECESRLWMIVEYLKAAYPNDEKLKKITPRSGFKAKVGAVNDRLELVKAIASSNAGIDINLDQARQELNRCLCHAQERNEILHAELLFLHASNGIVPLSSSDFSKTVRQIGPNEVNALAWRVWSDCAVFDGLRRWVEQKTVNLRNN